MTLGEKGPNTDPREVTSPEVDETVEEQRSYIVPWHIEKQDGKHCVVKGASGKSGETVACHPTRSEAVDHLRALYRNAEDSVQADSSPRFGIRLYFREGEKTVDGRAIDLGATNFDREPPYPVMLQRIRPESGGHALSELAGVITNIGRFGNVVIGEGFLSSSDTGQSAADLILEGCLQTWSPDIGNATTNVDDLTSPSDILRLTSGTFLGGTLVPFPAIDSAVVELFDPATGEVLMPAPARQGPLAAGGLNITINESTNASTTASAVAARILQASGPVRPPLHHFANPNLPCLQRYVTITDEGQIFGHLADSGHECHIGYGDVCVTAPQESDYSYFTVGTVQTAEGVLIPTGPIALKGGHADMSADAQSARAHYDDPSTAIADVTLGTDEFGIWFSGSLRPGVTDEQIRMLRASGVSGDWRAIDSQLRLIGICSVNVPGFPKVAIAADATGEISALVAAGGPPQPSNGCDCESNLESLAEEVSRLQAVITASGLTDAAFEALEADISE